MVILMAGLFVISCLTLVALIMFLKALNEFKAMLFDFIAPQGDKPSKLVEFLDGVSLMFTNRIIGSAEAALRGSAGGAAKSENALARTDMLGPLAPLMGGKLGKNPLIQGVLQALLNKFGQSGNQTAQSGGNHDSPRFKFGG